MTGTATCMLHTDIQEHTGTRRHTHPTVLEEGCSDNHTTVSLLMQMWHSVHLFSVQAVPCMCIAPTDLHAAHPQVPGQQQPERDAAQGVERNACLDQVVSATGCTIGHYALNFVVRLAQHFIQMGNATASFG
jgi:hypothetical protein